MIYALNLIFGLGPSLLFLIWVERNCSLPWLGIELGWPWPLFSDWAGRLIFSPAWTAAWDASLILLFGAIHTGLAQAGPRRHLPRPAYVIVTGVSLFLVMGFWQPTGIVLWSPHLPWAVLQGLSFLCFWGLMLGSLRAMRGFDFWEFLGLKPAKPSSPSSPLRRDGAYAWVRHPMYSFTLAAFVISPFLTLDRLVVFLASAAYLAFGIPIEERKLLATFGPAYARYRAETPALVPRFWRKKRLSASV